MHARGVIVIVKRNGPGDTSSNSGQDSLNSQKWYNSWKNNESNYFSFELWVV